MRRRPRLPPAYRLVALDQVDSTNSEARRLAVGENAEDGTLVWARRQTAGRGRHGRVWDSPAGNLYCSLVLRPKCTVAEAPQLCFVVALALFDGIGSVCEAGLVVSCKWPNDILLGDRKVAGILLECEAGDGPEPAFVIVGLGVNVVSYPEDAAFPATSLRAQGCASLSEIDVLEAFARHFLVWTDRWLDGGFAPVRKVWLQRAKGLGEPIRVRLGNETLAGTFAGLDADGALILGQEGGERRIAAGDVFLEAG